MAAPTRPLPPALAASLERASAAFAAFDAQVAAHEAGQLATIQSGATRTVTQFLQELDSWGITLTDWTLERGFSHAVVASVVSGSCKGSRGDASRVLLAMGVQPPPAKSRFALVRRAKGAAA